MSGTKVSRRTAFGNQLGKLALAWLVVIPGCVASAANSPVHTDPLNYDPLVREAFTHYYNLDYEGALSRFERVREAHPNDPIATAYVLNCVFIHELYSLDLLDTTFYANDGFLSGKHPVPEDPKVSDQVNDLADTTIRMADAEYTAHPDDLNALFVRGWARSLKATYEAMVERQYGYALRLALEAHSDHQHVLDKDPNYVDAKLVVGVYQYVIGSLSFGFKVVVGFAGIGGSKSKGLELLNDSATRGVISSIESRTCLAFFLRREAKYKQAIAIVRTQTEEYPHNFLFALEEANLLKDDGQGQAAIAAYRQIVSDAMASGYYLDAHLELAYFALGESLRGQKMYPDAVTAYEQASALPTTSPELKRRSLLAAGEVYDLMHQHEKARNEYLAVVSAGADTSQADMARKYMKSAYTR
jgi:tetratricopeptide (TPR) repeat protein